MVSGKTKATDGDPTETVLKVESAQLFVSVATRPTT